MKHRYIISLVLVVIFISPLLSNNGTLLSNDSNYSGIPEGMTNYVNSADPYSGTGPSLPVSLSGIATDRLGGSLQIDSSTSDIHTITLNEGWTGANLQTTIDSLSVDVYDVLTNPSFDDYHLEKWFVDSTAYYGDDVLVPDGWNIVKEVVDDYAQQHPQHGYYELDSTSSGYSGTRGVYVEAQLDSSYDADPNDEIYISQLVSMPYRELYSVEISFDYRVSSTSSMDDKIHLFVRLAGSTTKFHVFESGDTTDTWLSDSVIIPASSMANLSTKVMRFDIGIATDASGLGVASDAFGYLDNVKLDLVVRPFPEQIDLKVNGTAVVGSTSSSIYQYEPDDDTRDAWDLEGSGLNLNGNPYTGGDADPSVGVYSSISTIDWTAASTSQTGIQFPVDIPQGAIITSAYLEVEPIATTGNPTMRIYASGFSSSGTAIAGFTPGLPQLENRLTWVETSIDWDPGTWDSSVRIRHRSPEITPLIQSIVSEDNWTSGNHVCIMLDYLWSSNSRDSNSLKGAYGSTYSEDEFPRLFVEYMIPLSEDTVYFMQYEKDITVDHTQVSAILNDFPVLIDITDTDLKTDVQADGDDIVFMVGNEVLDFEIEYFDQGYSPTHAHLVAWVKVPTLYATRSTIITMAYGNPNAGSSSTTSVWDDFETVHHLADDPTGTIYDSTANNYDGTSFGGMTSGDLVTGIAGNAINFNYDSGTPANSDMINIGQIFTDDWDSFTVSLWVNMDFDRDCRVFSKSPTTNPNTHILTTRIAARTLTARLRTDTTGGSYSANTSFALGNWQYLVWSWDASRGSVEGYMNATAVLSDTHSGTNMYDSNDVFVIANNNMETNGEQRFFDGMLDEIRLTRSIRSAAWIEAEYNNQVDPSSFVSVGAERTIQSSWTDTESTSVVFSTTSSAPVDIFPIVTMDIVGGGQSLDENMQEGTSFYVANDTIVEWTANILVSPPADTDTLNVIVDYPLTEWKPLTVTNPIGQLKTYGTDWTYHDGSIVIFGDAVDIWGVWTIEFNSWNYVYDLKLGPTDESDYDTYSFSVNDDAEFKISSPWIENGRAGLVLTDPDGNTWYTDFATTGTPGSTWDIPSFSNRMQLTVPAAQVDADVTNFPLLVSFVDADFQDTTKVQADGDDFVFVQSGEVLAHEIDRFEQITGRLVAWVRANLSSTVDNTFWLYYGNPVIGSTESPETLWSNGYDAVWLLNEDVINESSGGLHIDSTSNGYVGTQYGNSRTSGIANGYGQSFDGNDYIAINSSESLQPSGDVTISGWFYIDSVWSSASTPSKLIMSKYLDGDDNFHIALVGSEYTESGVAAGSLAFGFENSNGEYTKWTTRVSWAAGWYHFACVMDADTPTNNKIYINGADNTDAGSAGGASSVSLAFDADWGIGGRYVETSEFPTGEAFHTGSIDEIRIATTPRAASWFDVEYDNMLNIGAFVVEGAEQSRTSPEHKITKVMDSSAPAGLWTVSVYYNDTGATVSYKTGLYERNFIVKHDSSLSLINPTDAVSDKTAYKVAGEILYIEVELTDGADKVTGAIVTMNWSVSGTPTELTLSDIGNGRYGKSVDTADLGDEGQYRINFNSYHQYYNNATDYFDLELYHATELDFTDVDSTPVGFDFTATLIFEDAYDETPITGATITFENGTLVNVVAEGAGRYNISLGTGGLSYGDHVFVFKATKAGAYMEEGSVTVTFNLRKHFTSVSVIGDFVTPYGEATPVTIVIIDSDTGIAIATTSSIDSWSFTSGYAPVSETNPPDFVVSLTTGTWLVGPETVTLSVSLSGIYYSPIDYDFDIQIRNHHTSVTVLGDLTTPYGQTTDLTLVITDTDTGTTLTFSSVDSFTFTSGLYGAYGDPSPADLDFTLDTSTWNVAIETVTLSVVMTGNYNNPTDYDFDIIIRNHHTSVTVIGDLTTPYGQTTDLTLVITDTDTGTTLTFSSVDSFAFTSGLYGAYGDPSPADLDFTLDTSTWNVAIETVTLSVVMTGNYNNPTDYDFDIIIRNHYTSVVVIGNLISPYGTTTSLTIVITDTDTGATLTFSSVDSFAFTSGLYGAYGDPSPADLDFLLDTSTWNVATEAVTLSVVMTGNYYDPNDYDFDIEIRDRLTSITVIGNLETPYGNVTKLTIVITDVDSGTTLSATDVSSFSFGSSYGPLGETDPSDLVYDLDTSTWLVAGESVTLSVVMLGNYQNPTDYVFIITIRSMTTSIINEPNDLRYPTGADFKIVVTVNVNEQGNSFGDSVTGMLQGEFTIENSTHTIPIKEFFDLTNGRYNITIDASYFPQGIYTIYITVTPADNVYAESQMTLIFEYTPARSELSSPDRAVTTPYDTDFVVTLTFLDIDRDEGIDGATITALGITIYNQQYFGNGVYQVNIDVSGLAKGEHLYDLTADKAGYEAQTISFKAIIRIAFTYAIPTVGALDIPVGDDPVFFVEYWDIDHDLPITDGAPFLATSDWIHSVTITYIPLEERYRVTFTTNDDDTLRQNFVVSFNFSKGENYQFGQFNISITIRTHNTDFRLVSAVEPVSYTDNITISVFYGDIDSGEGIASQYVTHRVWNGTVNVLSYLYNVSGQSGYYTIIVPAQQFGGLGLQDFTIFFNWTGPVSTYTDSYIITSANIVGEDSQLTLLVTAEPTPYLEDMEYTLFYSAINGTGISNVTGNVIVSVEFVGETIDLSQVLIWEINPVTDKGKYSIKFNTALFAKTGLIYMKVYINWTEGVEPFYSNRIDTISVRILARDSLVSIDPPIQTAYNVNATFSFTYDDVTGALNEPIANDAKLTITTSLSDYSITYDGPSRTFTISFDTIQFGALGIQTFTLDVRWDGAPFYANQTGRSISVTVIARQTVLDYQAPSPTQYLDNVTFSVTWTDVIEGSTGIVGATITLYDGIVPISSTYYTVYEIGLGVYSVVLNTTYKASPSIPDIKVNITSTDFYYVSREDTRSLTIRFRSTITSSEPINTVPYSSSFTVILYYQDIITLDVIGNGSSLVTFDILNGSSWIYTIEWKQALGYYELTVETSNQATLVVGSVYSLHVNMSYDISSPFYKHDDAYISFEIRSRASSLERQLAPIPTSYLDNVTFTIYFSDADDLSPIASADIYVLNGVTPLNLGTEYFYSHLGGGVYQIIVRTDVLDGLGVTTVTVQADWTGGTPFHDDAELDINLTVTERTTNVEIVTPPSQTNYLEDVIFVVSFIDLGTGTEIPATKDLVTILNGGVPLTPAQFTMTEIGSTLTYEISISSSVLSTDLVTNRIITVYIDWPDTPNYYKDDSTSTSATTIARSTYVSVDRPGNTAYGENATFTFSFIDSTTLPEVLVERTGDMSITFNLTENPGLDYDPATRLFTVSFDTSQFGDVGLAVFYINVTWIGSPYYANKTLQLVYVTVTMRQTQVFFEAPAPTPYGDVVTFDVSYLDISGAVDVGISDGTLTIYDDEGVPIPGVNYVVTPDGSGNFEIQFYTDFFSEPGLYSLNVSLVYTGGYFRNDASAVRTLNVRYRTTILSANPVGQIGYETTLEITLLFQDILTLADIDDTSTTFTILNNTGTSWDYTIDWQPATSSYLLVITTVGQTTLILGDHALWLNMSYAGVDPFYRWDDIYVEFTIRTRTSALDLQEAAIPAPFGEDVSFVVYYWDADITEGISLASFVLEESGIGVLTPGVDYFVVDGLPGVYSIYIDSTVLGSLGTYSISVTAVWSGAAPYHNNAQRDVSVTTIQRTASVDILEPANQPRYLDNVTFTFAYIDSITGLQIPGISSSDISIYANGTLLNIGDYVLTPVGSTYIVSINSTILSAILIQDFNVSIFVNWDDGTSPFYTDDGTSMKVSTTGRIILVEPQQIETTPVGDLMNVTFILVDEDNGNPISGAIILFRCVNPSRTLTEGNEYTLTSGINPGEYIISINSNALVFGPGDIGDFIFELEVQWNQNNQPFYKNRSPITLTGEVDLILANIRPSVLTSTVQLNGNVTIEITLEDLDHHNQGIDLPINVIDVYYFGTSIIPSLLDINYQGSGIYSIEFSTFDLTNPRSQFVNITINYYPYTPMFSNPSFTVTEIITILTPFETEIILNWTEEAYIVVGYNDTLNLNLTSGASVSWTYGTASGIFAEIGTTGVYGALVNTSLADSGTEIVVITADKDKYQLSVTTVTLIVLALPSELVIESPEAVFEHDRGDPIDVVIHLTDEYNGGVTIQSGITSVYMMFEDEKFDLTFNGTDYTWYTTLPSNATATLEPGLMYSARIFAESTNYNPASSVFRIDLQATSTTIYLVDDTQPKMDVVYNEIVTFTLNFTETEAGTTIDNATIRWVHSGFAINETFTYNVVSGLWELHFNTSEMAFGTWGIAFYGLPDDPNLGEDVEVLTITIKKIVTEVISPIPGEKFWGWTGYVTFFYNDTYFGGGIANATATYQWGIFSGSAIDHGNGNYSIFINTTLLETGIRYPVIISFNKENYEVSAGGISLYIEEVPTEVNLFTPSDNRIDDNIDELELPFGDSIAISFYYGDIDDSDGYVGGLSGATITATIYGGGLGTTISFDIVDLGNGTYHFVFDSTSTELFVTGLAIPQALPNNPFTLTIEVELPYREAHSGLSAISITITIIERPTTLEFSTDNSVDIVDDSITMFYGETIVININYYESWLDVPGAGITGAYFTAKPDRENQFVEILNISTIEPGIYRLTIQVGSPLIPLGINDEVIDITIVLSLDNYEEKELELSVTILRTESMITLNTAITYATPSLFLIFLVAVLWTRHFSIPKRLRQLNGQIKKLGKGKIPKPIEDSKSRQQLVAELFNDTFQKLEITREAIDMPDSGVPIKVPEIGELLIQLSILTRLSPDELDEFNADISKMKMSEQAAFVKEVINQEAIRAARAKGKTVEEILEEVATEASKKIKSPDEVMETTSVPDEPVEERVFLVDEEVETKEPETIVETPSEEKEIPTEKLSQFELDELKAELLKKGVPKHEIDIIIEQARQLSRELVDELVESLGLKD